MKKIMYIIYTSLPFFICSILVGLSKLSNPGGGIFDLSGAAILISDVFYGIVLLITNLLLFGRLSKKLILNQNQGKMQIVYLVTYSLICIFSAYAMDEYSYNLASMFPIIIALLILGINIIIKLDVDKSISNKMSYVFFIIFVLALFGSLESYYGKARYIKEWAQMHEGIVIWDSVKRIDENVDRFYTINATKKSDIVYSVELEEVYYYNTEEEGIKIKQYLEKINIGKFSNSSFIKENFKYSYCIECSLGGMQEPKLTEDSLNRFNPMIKNVTVDNKISYSRLKKLLGDNGYSYLSDADY
ncbi:MAG TPA: hypothetical protein DEP72_00235 [Clostridiales bacterium]|nr:hypothetical protein [Clostridiales bacterium]